MLKSPKKYQTKNKYNTPKIYIESIFMDKNNTLIYASTQYIKIMQP